MEAAYCNQLKSIKALRHQQHRTNEARYQSSTRPPGREPAPPNAHSHLNLRRLCQYVCALDTVARIHIECNLLIVRGVGPIVSEKSLLFEAQSAPSTPYLCWRRRRNNGLR